MSLFFGESGRSIALKRKPINGVCGPFTIKVESSTDGDSVPTELSLTTEAASITTLIELNVQGLWASRDAHKPLYDNAGA